MPVALGVFCGHHYDARTRQTGGPYTYSRDRHGLLIGPTGCSKTAGFLQNNLLADNLIGGSLILTDPKAELAAVSALSRARRGDQVAIIDPFGILRALVQDKAEYAELIGGGLVESIGFNPMRALDPRGPNFYDDSAAIGEALIKIEGADSHWTESA